MPVTIDPTSAAAGAGAGEAVDSPTAIPITGPRRWNARRSSAVTPPLVLAAATEGVMTPKIWCAGLARLSYTGERWRDIPNQSKYPSQPEERLREEKTGTPPLVTSWDKGAGAGWTPE